MGSMAAFDQTGASIAPFVVLLVSDLSTYIHSINKITLSLEDIVPDS